MKVKLDLPHGSYLDKKYKPLTLKECPPDMDFLTEEMQQKIVTMLRNERACMLLRQRYIKQLNRKLIEHYVKNYPEDFI